MKTKGRYRNRWENMQTRWVKDEPNGVFWMYSEIRAKRITKAGNRSLNEMIKWLETQNVKVHENNTDQTGIHNL